MRTRDRCALLTVALLLSAAAPASAAPPANDNYLASTTINAVDGSLPREYRDAVDTSEATTQPDTFNPDRDGMPLAGGRPEPTSCAQAPVIGRTVWYDFLPRAGAGVEIVAAGFDATIAVYEWDARTSQLLRLVACANATAAPTEDLLLLEELRGGRNYTIQVGGAGGAGGPLDFRFSYFPDRDSDGILDEQPDSCPDLPGIAAFGGCPPLARGAARVAVERSGGSVRITRLVAERLDRGSRVEASCGSCGRALRRTAKRGGVVRFKAFEGRTVRAGGRIRLRITHPPAGAGRYRNGAYGKTLEWPIAADGLGRLRVTCTLPGSSREVRCP